MAAATQLAMSASSFFCPTSISSRQLVQPTKTSQSSPILVVYQHDNSTTNFSRRLFAVAAASATTGLGVLQPGAAQARRTKAEPETKKAESEAAESKDLSAYDARVLANAKRRDAMKASVEAAKLKAKSFTPSAVDTVTDIVSN